ncbi:MAG: 23S rRNA (adenine(2503)-C(2))-methyltransferase RlmN [Holosporales bacterium]|jgi:23S rRNA (adenine2503-C2)-methyltransferase|nr:23S rRNA (adenine(2503)-C(2))-methyltransferase RlmN [Holosporales bacterium]
MKKGILNYTKNELKELLNNIDIPKFRADQIFIWIYRYGKCSFSHMTNLSKTLQDQLDKEFYIYRPRISNVLESADGTLKFLLELEDKNAIETVFIPEIRPQLNNSKKWNRATVCVSSQVGCSVGCKFCNTGYNGFIRNLSVEEIISQFLIVKDYLKLWDSEDRLSNIVFMGMGEPLFNYENVLKSIENLMSDEDEGLSRRKITLSTSGISSVLLKIAKDIPCRLAISLHAPNDGIRSPIMPINNIYNVASIIDACEEYTKYHEYLKITIEYLLLKGINDSKDCAKELVKLIRKLNAKVNLLQFNSWNGCQFEPSDQKSVNEFSEILKNAGIETTFRARRGEDIMAACGQLAT